MLTSATRIDRGLECLDGSLESKPVRDERFQVNQSAFDETWWREGRGQSQLRLQERRVQTVDARIAFGYWFA